ncbi:uncharacterized protein TNIN_451821 [Trichonephila inaurata madagascariensis]|uniref:Uncharacterized protein n=1 Tax=Trichonephila inaurata madagascariensis TaxID=2747483 RepID=A0A8X6XAQ9_9ARAC|nr:uncharacterized protein TNIN_451821 [Trichonephila inaurata madagascariensis]
MNTYNVRSESYENSCNRKFANSAVFVIEILIIIGISHGVPWYKAQDLDSLHASDLTETLTNNDKIPKKSLRLISKRSADWSNRQLSSTLLSHDNRPEPQQSENVEVTTKLPKIIRKVRLQNVPRNTRHFDQNGISVDRNNSATFDKQGRVVRIKKFRRRTTTVKPNPVSTTGYTVTAPNPTTSRSITPPMEYSHITVINKEYVDQKPRRKQRNKNKTRLWVPTTSDARGNPKEINDVTPSLYPEESEVKKHSLEDIYNEPNARKRYSSSESVAGSNQNALSSQRRNENQDIALQLNAQNLQEQHTPRDRLKGKNSFSQIRPPNSRQFSQSGIIDETKRNNSQQASNLPSISDTTPMTLELKSVEILSDAPHNSNSPILQTIPQPGLNVNNTTDHEKRKIENRPHEFVGEISSQSPVNPPSGQIHQNNEFGQFPREHHPIFQGYPPYEMTNPYFRSQQPQLLGMPNSQNGNPLLPLNFQQPFSPFHRNNDQRFPDYFSSPLQLTPYHRTGQLGRPDFYPSPQLASLRRSVMDAYTEEESTESTTEFSIPKFEIPSIDFNDKGCRTVYKEVSAVPSDGFNKRTQESKAKSFIMTRECFFPDGVPTTKSTEIKEQVENVTPPTKDV